jgi:hypothetical protein
MTNLRKKTVQKLLSPGTSNSKTQKNEFLTYILYMAPAAQNSIGRNLCPESSPGCVAGCLFTAGRAAIFSMINEARSKKTEFFLSNRNEFLQQLKNELKNAEKLAAKKEAKVVVRLNGTTDIDFVKLFKTIGFDALDNANLHYYDYTKILHKAIKHVNTKNYTVTFSRSETNWNQCTTALEAGVNVSVVADHKMEIPSHYKGFPVVDGDAADDVMLKVQGHVIWLKAKGRAKKDTTGFVIRSL